VKEFKALDGFIHVRKNGANKSRVYKVSGGERLCCQCRNEGPDLRVQLEKEVAKSNVTTLDELKELVQKCLPGIAASRRIAPLKTIECNHFWAGKYTRQLVTHGFHYFGEIIPPAICEGMKAIHISMLRNRNYGHKVATVDGYGPRSKFLNLEDMLTQTFGRPKPLKTRFRINISGAGIETITNARQVAIVKKFVQVLEDYVGRKQSRVTMLNCMYEYHTPDKAPPEFHQDMCTQSLGMIINLGDTIKGTQFLKYPASHCLQCQHLQRPRHSSKISGR
jgi:hypothetical protein